MDRHDHEDMKILEWLRALWKRIEQIEKFLGIPTKSRHHKRRRRHHRRELKAQRAAAGVGTSSGL